MKGMSIRNVASCPRALERERSPSVAGRANAVAERLEQGAGALAAFARALTDAQWRTAVLKDGRKIGVVVHHVASVYPLEIQLAHTLASGKPVTGVTMDDVHAMNAAHAKEYDAVTKEATLDLQRNSDAAATAIRTLSDEDLDRAAETSPYSNAPIITCQFMLEDHAVRHSYHHSARIQQTVRP
jgi:hypothetical protein